MSTYSNELYHYGVLGMKWGVHKAKSYAYDTSAHRMRVKNKAARKDYKSGKITKAQYKNIKAANKRVKEDEDINTNVKLSGTKVNYEKKISDIYKDYKDKAYSEIPNYAVKRGAKTAAKTLAVAGAVGLSVYASKMAKKSALLDNLYLQDKVGEFTTGVKYHGKHYTGVDLKQFTNPKVSSVDFLRKAEKKTGKKLLTSSLYGDGVVGQAVKHIPGLDVLNMVFKPRDASKSLLWNANPYSRTVRTKAGEKLLKDMSNAAYLKSKGARLASNAATAGVAGYAYRAHKKRHKTKRS